MAKQHDLYFANPVFHTGINITVRDDNEWMKKAEIGDELFLQKTGEGKVGFIVPLVGKMYLPLNWIPDEVLNLEHDPLCRTFDGLLHEMRRVYRPEFSITNMVAVLFFRF